MNQNTQSLRQELAWFIVNRMNDAVGFDEAYEEVGEYLKIIEKRIDSIERFPSNNEYQVCWNKGADDIIKQIKELLK